MKRIMMSALLAAVTILGLKATATDPVSMTITLKNNTTVSYLATDLDSVRFVGGKFGEIGAVGMKVYTTSNSGVSVDYLYSQIESIEYGLQAPLFSHESGTVFTENTTVTISSPSGVGTVYYTIDGSDPGTNNYYGSGSGNATLVIDDTMSAEVTVKAVVVNGSENSVVTSATYSVRFPVDAPTFSRTSGSIFTNETTKVTISGATGATIYYTTDGSTPSATNYAGSGVKTVTLTVSKSMTVNAIAIKDGVSSSVSTATYTVSNSSSGDNNKNRNSLSSYYDNSKYMYRLEWPHIKENANQSWVAKSESGYGLALELEWDNSLIANRYTCYYLDSKNLAQNVSRNDSFKEDPELPSATRSTLSDYSGSGFSRGHLCPSGDRRASNDQQALTYYLSNMQPQYQSHNGAQWANLEGDVRTWAANYDTLYVVKAGTIDNVTLNGTTKSGLKSVKCNNRLPVPDYFYMALLGYNKSTGTYNAIGIWTYHYNATSERQSTELITIDELEKRTGIDFFCNLPDDVEDDVESRIDTSLWPLSSRSM